MSRKDRYIRQHDNLRDTAQKIMYTLNKDTLDYNEMTSILNKFAGQLRIHLKTEDDFLFPSLESSDDKEIKNAANKFDKKIHDISDEFKDYKNRYKISKNIRENENKFKKETKDIIGKLANRMEDEEKKLYIYLD